jgi:hypothetical protein
MKEREKWGNGEMEYCSNARPKDVPVRTDIHPGGQSGGE